MKIWVLFFTIFTRCENFSIIASSTSILKWMLGWNHFLARLWTSEKSFSIILIVLYHLAATRTTENHVLPTTLPIQNYFISRRLLAGSFSTFFWCERRFADFSYYTWFCEIIFKHKLKFSQSFSFYYSSFQVQKTILSLYSKTEDFMYHLLNTKKKTLLENAWCSDQTNKHVLERKFRRNNSRIESSIAILPCFFNRKITSDIWLVLEGQKVGI